MILKKGWFSDLEILEIYIKKVNKEGFKQNLSTRNETLNTEEQEIRNTTHHSTTKHASTWKQNIYLFIVWRLNIYRADQENHDYKDDYIINIILYEQRLETGKGRN